MRNGTLLRSAALRALQCALLLGCGDDVSGPQLSNTTGSIRVLVALTGVDLPSKYQVMLGDREQSTPADASPTFYNLQPGVYSVSIRVPANCQVTGLNPREATVVGGQMTTVEFSVTCTMSTGSIQVTAGTTGVDLDPDGYRIRLEGVTVGGNPYLELIRIPATGTVTIARVPAGPMRVTLDGLSLNCNVEGTNPRVVSVAATETLALAFDIRCAADTDVLAYVGNSDDGRTDIYLVKADGTGTRRLTVQPSSETDPAWSADGKRIAFATDRDGNREIYVMDADGGATVRLTNEPSADYHPSWSPDGLRIAFVSERDGNAEIYVVNADGSNPVRLTNHASRDSDPVWSPDSRRIAFTSERDSRAEVYIMDGDGSGLTKFTLEGGSQPAWSPDGTRIAFAAQNCPFYAYVCPPSIFVKPITGAGDRLSATIGDGPSWSPDGRKIAYDGMECDFYFYECDRVAIRIARVDGTSVVGDVRGHSPAWRP